MNITVYDQPKELLVQTVRIHKNPQDPTGLILFRCPYCCDPILQMQGLATQISPGLEPSSDVVLINRAAGCDLRYVFQSSRRSSDDVTRVILNSFEHDHKVANVFHCYICRTPLVNFIKDIWVLNGGMGPAQLPILVDCSKPGCPAKYWVVDVV